MIPAVTAFPTPLIPAQQQGEESTAELRRLTTALAQGEDEAWSHFNRLYGPAVFRQLLALTRGDHDLAKEALQRTYLRVAKYVRPCETEAMFRAWLRTVARTALQDCWRRQRSFTDLLFRKRQEPPEMPDRTGDERLMAELDAALARLDATNRELLEAKYFLGCEVRTIADRLAITPKAVESRLTRARECLRRELLAVLQRHE